MTSLVRAYSSTNALIISHVYFQRRAAIFRQILDVYEDSDPTEDGDGREDDDSHEGNATLGNEGPTAKMEIDGDFEYVLFEWNCEFIDHTYEFQALSWRIFVAQMVT
jgi:hypothetical protein